MIDTDKYEAHIKDIVICEEEWIKGQDSLVEDSRRLKDTALKLLAEVKRLREGIDDIANNMEAADPVYLQGFVDDLLELLP